MVSGIISNSHTLLQCYCGNTISLGATLSNVQGDCGMVCSGNKYEYCGAGNRLTMYNNTALVASVSSMSSSSTSISSTSTVASIATRSSSATSSSTSVTGTIAASPTATVSTAYRGCYAEPNGSRALPEQAYSSSSNTPELCQSSCVALGYSIAGTEYGSECWCANQFSSGTAARPDSDCDFACPGNSAELCGAGNRLSVYSNLTTLPTASSPTSPSTAGSYSLLGCYADSVGSRTFPVTAGGGSVENCASSCRAYQYFGVEYSNEVSPVRLRS